MAAFRKDTAASVDRSYMRSAYPPDDLHRSSSPEFPIPPEIEEAQEPLLSGMAESLSYPHGKGVDKGIASLVEIDSLGQEHLADALPPHESYEGVHRWDPNATWTAHEEAAVVRKTDLYLLSWVCLMVRRQPYLLSNLIPTYRQ